MITSRRDYILRLVEEAAALLARALGFAGAKEHDRALEVLGQACGLLLDLAPGNAEDGDLFARLTRGEEGLEVRNKCLLFTALLHRVAEISAAEHREAQAAAARENALDLFLQTLLRYGEGGLPPYAPSLEQLLAGFGETPIPATSAARMVWTHEAAGRLADAEEALISLGTRAPGSTKVREIGLEFYQRLLALDDSILEQASLTRSELQIGLANWQAFHS